MALDDQFQGVGDSASDDDCDISGGTRYVAAITSPLGKDDFEYYWADELVQLYHNLKDHAYDQGWPLFENLNFCDFCKFAYDKSSRTKPSVE